MIKNSGICQIISDVLSEVRRTDPSSCVIMLLDVLSLLSATVFVLHTKLLLLMFLFPVDIITHILHDLVYVIKLLRKDQHFNVSLLAIII